MKQTSEKTPIPDRLTKEGCADIAKWFSDAPPQREYILKDLIQVGLCGTIQAAGGVGKSHMINIIALSIATGRKIGPFQPPKPRRVLIVNVEDPASECRIRIFAANQVMGFSDEETLLCRENFLFFPGTGIISEFMTIDSEGNRVPTPCLDWLRNAVSDLQPELVILDTKIRLFGLDENNNADNALWLSQLETISKKSGVAFLISHHTGKGEEARYSLSPSVGRGASSQEFNSRFVLSMAEVQKRQDGKIWEFPDGFPEIKMKLSKANYSKTSEIFFFRRHNTEGIPVSVAAIQKQSGSNMGRILAQWVAEQEGDVRETHLKRGQGAGVEDLKKRLSQASGKKAGQTTIRAALQAAIKQGWVEIGEVRSSGAGRSAKIVIATGNLCRQNSA